MTLRVNSSCTTLSGSFLPWCIVYILQVSTYAKTEYRRILQKMKYVWNIWCNFESLTSVIDVQTTHHPRYQIGSYTSSSSLHAVKCVHQMMQKQQYGSTKCKDTICENERIYCNYLIIPHTSQTKISSLTCCIKTHTRSECSSLPIQWYM